ncbi:tannase/feruloyl esterase family alpha/beta hydrolase [Cohnella sp. GCM10020058]|uniref:tannase/feruloyl esterase family alpha/beta hydrolase n=1 Tax=Cohnella sp. GCM10020058 TaxID=3317330 RepID=UPI0036439F79
MDEMFNDFDMEGCTITSVQIVTEGSFTYSNSGTITDLPAFCRIAVQIKPTPSSNIRVEVWLPQQNWNGRFLGTGNGGSAGSIAYGSLAFGLRRGYATANTDLGTSPHVDSAIGQPERWADFGYRATHEMTVVAKELIELYYRRPASYAYFTGCSTGGQQALMEAQRYPEDYNGILAGAPANNRTHLHTGFLWNYIAGNQLPDEAVFTKAKIEAVTNAVIEQWRGKDGGVQTDNFLTDPRKCDFNPDTILNDRDSDHDNRLNTAQVSALKQIYAGPTNPRTGEQIYTALPYGSESCPGGLDLLQDPERLASSLLYMFRWVFGSDYDYKTFDFDHDLDLLNERLAPLLNANNPDVNPMKALGGKILMYTGLSDPLVPYQDALHYYERVIEAQGGLAQTQDFFRLFLIPGMGHGGGGPGLNDIGPGDVRSDQLDSEHDLLDALVAWVENGKAPEKLIATAFKDGFAPNGIRFQRPVFPYPKFPEYAGGDPKLPSSFLGIDHERGGVRVAAERYLI